MWSAGGMDDGRLFVQNGPNFILFMAIWRAFLCFVLLPPLVVQGVGTQAMWDHATWSFSHINHVPQCSTLLTCLEMPKKTYSQWVRGGGGGRAGAPQGSATIGDL